MNRYGLGKNLEQIRGGTVLLLKEKKDLLVLWSLGLSCLIIGLQLLLVVSIQKLCKAFLLFSGNASDWYY